MHLIFYISILAASEYIPGLTEETWKTFYSYLIKMLSGGNSIAGFIMRSYKKSFKKSEQSNRNYENACKTAAPGIAIVRKTQCSIK